MQQAGWELYRGEYFAARNKISAKELDYLILRLTQASFAASGLTGFSFDAFVKIDIGREITDELEKRHAIWIETVFFVCLGFTIAFGIFSIVIAVLSVMKAQRMALHGNVDADLIQRELPRATGIIPGAIGDGYMAQGHDQMRQRLRTLSQDFQQKESDDLQRAIQALRKVQPYVLGSIAASLACFVTAAIAMAWIKTIWIDYDMPTNYTGSGEMVNSTAVTLSSIIGTLGLSLVAAFLWMNHLFAVRTFHQSGLHRRAVVPPYHPQRHAAAPATSTRH